MVVEEEINTKNMEKFLLNKIEDLLEKHVMKIELDFYTLYETHDTIIDIESFKQDLYKLITDVSNKNIVEKRLK